MIVNREGLPIRSVGVLSLIGVLAVLLKVTGALNLSWVWVLAPFWICLLAIYFFIMGVCLWVGFRKR